MFFIIKQDKGIYDHKTSSTEDIWRTLQTEVKDKHNHEATTHTHTQRDEK